MPKFKPRKVSVLKVSDLAGMPVEINTAEGGLQTASHPSADVDEADNDELHRSAADPAEPATSPDVVEDDEDAELIPDEEWQHPVLGPHERDPNEQPDVVVSADVSRDPGASVAAALMGVGKLYNDAGVLSTGLSKHIPAVAAEPELHSFLQRMQIALGEYRHAVSQVEDAMSDRLREAIEHGVS
jgi:hypothetical protein